MAGVVPLGSCQEHYRLDLGGKRRHRHRTLTKRRKNPTQKHLLEIRVPDFQQPLQKEKGTGTQKQHEKRRKQKAPSHKENISADFLLVEIGYEGERRFLTPARKIPKRTWMRAEESHTTPQGRNDHDARALVFPRLKPPTLKRSTLTCAVSHPLVRLHHRREEDGSWFCVCVTVR